MASSGVSLQKENVKRHVGVLGIIVKPGYQNIGIGTEIMKTLIDQARKIGLKRLVLTVFETNNRARHVYQKIGFKETGRIPKGFYRDGKFIDEIIMVKNLEEDC